MPSSLTRIFAPGNGSELSDKIVPLIDPVWANRREVIIKIANFTIQSLL